MATTLEESVLNQVKQVARGLEYDAKIDLGSHPFRRFNWFRNREFRPDILVQHDNRAVIVEVKSRPVMLYDVFLVDQARKGKDMGAVICVPDDSFPRIREGTRGYAEEMNVRLCPLSEVGDALKAMLH